MNRMEETKQFTDNELDTLALSCKRLKAKGWTLERIMDNHGLTMDALLALLSRHTPNQPQKAS